MISVAGGAQSTFHSIKSFRMIFLLFVLGFGFLFRIDGTKPPNDDKSKSYGLLNTTRLSREVLVLVDYRVLTMWRRNITFSFITRIIYTRVIDRTCESHST